MQKYPERDELVEPEDARRSGTIAAKVVVLLPVIPCSSAAPRAVSLCLTNMIGQRASVTLVVIALAS